MAKVTAFRLSRPEAVALLRSLAADSSNVVFLPHALLRMRQRKITPREVIACLRLGNVIEARAGPERVLGHAD